MVSASCPAGIMRPVLGLGADLAVATAPGPPSDSMSLAVPVPSSLWRPAQCMRCLNSYTVIAPALPAQWLSQVPIYCCHLLLLLLCNADDRAGVRQLPSSDLP